MPDLQWKESDSVGIVSLDAQHQGLFATAHRLREAMRASRAASIQQEILAELVAYSRAHCEREERVMETAAFPGLTVHRQLHRAFLERVQDFQRTVYSSREGFSHQRMDSLCRWMCEHVVLEDARYAVWIQRREFRPVVHEMRKQSNP